MASVIAESDPVDEAQKTHTEAALRRARGLAQRTMAAAISTRTVPHLEFVHDAGIEGAIRMNKLLADLREEREARERERGEQPPEDEPDAS